ncbi:hypothetical protein [Paraburkholderia antibiotica]|uniref:Lipoprotein n=1 Tax=Paraburkholderia antibiotica TaxID=2728839 RepID=A0A7X9X4U7_9BURK|nr:hypothetical protein [Paraburkholderia antibiotica]NML31468.1 hypothetical protein [Paraburkholderia antibiotica]
MWKSKFAAIVILSIVISACAHSPADQRELAHVQWLPAIKAIIRSGDLADYQNVAARLNLILDAKEPVPAKDVDGNIIGESIDVETMPPANSSDNGKIRFRYGILVPKNRPYKRAMLTVRNIGLGGCITTSDIYKEFGYVRQTTYPHSDFHSADYHFRGDNTIDLYFIFVNKNEQCAEEVSIFQNRWK